MCDSGVKPFSVFLPPQSWIISLLFHTFSLHLLDHRVSPPQNLTLQPPAFVKASPLQLFLLSPEYFLPAFNLPSLLFPFPQSLLTCIGFLLSKRKKKCLFHVILPFSSYNNITSRGGVPHAMTSWPLSAHLSLTGLAGFYFFLLFKLNSVNLSKTFYFFFPRVVPSACYFQFLVYFTL